jgi:hypothetical protein
MTAVGGFGSVPSLDAAQAAGGAMTVARASRTLKLEPNGTVAIADTLENVQKNLDALQGVAARISEPSTTSASRQLSVTAWQ